MRKKVKKFLRKGAGVILTLVMLLTLVNINGLTAYAEGEETAEDEPAGDALWFWYVSDSGEFTAMGTPELPTEKVSALVEKDSGYELTQYDTYDAAIGENAKVIYDPENPKKLTLEKRLFLDNFRLCMMDRFLRLLLMAVWRIGRVRNIRFTIR